MKHTILLVIALCLGACGQTRQDSSALPDGHWWLAANPDQRDGFLEGFYECDFVMLGHSRASVPDGIVESAITQFYRIDPAKRSVSLIMAIRNVDQGFRTRGYKTVFGNRRNDPNDGRYWGLGSASEREGLVRGFIACQKQNGEAPRIGPDELERRTSAYLEVGPEGSGIMGDAHIGDKLYAIFLRMENQRP